MNNEELSYTAESRKENFSVEAKKKSDEIQLFRQALQRQNDRAAGMKMPDDMEQRVMNRINAQSSENHEWPDDYFPVRNSEITEWTGLEERNIRAIRNRFQQIGLIGFHKGDGKKSDPEYRIFYFGVVYDH